MKVYSYLYVVQFMNIILYIRIIYFFVVMYFLCYWYWVGMSDSFFLKIDTIHTSFDNLDELVLP